MRPSTARRMSPRLPCCVCELQPLAVGFQHPAQRHRLVRQSLLAEQQGQCGDVRRVQLNLEFAAGVLLGRVEQAVDADAVSSQVQHDPLEANPLAGPADATGQRERSDRQTSRPNSSPSSAALGLRTSRSRLLPLKGATGLTCPSRCAACPPSERSTPFSTSRSPDLAIPPRMASGASGRAKSPNRLASARGSFEWKSTFRSGCRGSPRTPSTPSTVSVLPRMFHPCPDRPAAVRVAQQAAGERHRPDVPHGSAPCPRPATQFLAARRRCPGRFRAAPRRCRAHRASTGGRPACRVRRALKRTRPGSKPTSASSAYAVETRPSIPSALPSRARSGPSRVPRTWPCDGLHQPVQFTLGMGLQLSQVAVHFQAGQLVFRIE